MSRFLRMFVKSCVLHTNDIDVSRPEWSKIEEKFWGMQDMHTPLLLANLDFDSRLQHVSYCVPDE